MPISYPLSLPSSPGFTAVRMRAVNLTGRSKSTFTGQQQVTQWAGEWWEGEYELPPMTRADAEAWIVFLLKLRGGVGTMLLPPEKPARTAQGTASGVTVNGAGQTGTTLAMSGSGTLVAGDWIQVGTGATASLHKVLVGGTLGFTADIFPRLRTPPSSGSTVVVSNAVGLFRLDENFAEWDVNTARHYGLRFKAVEAI